MPSEAREWGLLDLEMAQGADYKREIQLKDSQGDVVPLSGFTGRMQIRDDDDNLLLDLIDGNGINISDDIIMIHATAAQTEALNFDRANYDVEIEEIASTEVRRVLAGFVRLSKEITK